jgi:hypothetical protein
MKTLFTFVLPIGILLCGLYLSFTTNILKDSSQNPNKPYSFSKTQLIWWSLIIICCYSAYFGINGKVATLDQSILILLGISLGTTTAARMIDVNEIQNRISRHQDQNNAKSFLPNILSDKEGISVPRFQSLCFNLVFGLIFITTFLSDNTFYQFGTIELTLLGISSAGYVGMKSTENK